MPPRVVKRGGGTAAAKRAARAAKDVAKTHNQKVEPVVEAQEIVKAEEVTEVDQESLVSVQPDTREVDKYDKISLNDEDAPMVEEDPDDVQVKGIGSSKKEDGLNDTSMEEYGKDERLDLDDNDPEYEPEEYGGEDYDEKDTEKDDVHQREDEDYEEVDEEGDDQAQDETADIPEELDSEGDDEHGGEEQRHEAIVEAEEDDHHEVVEERRKRKEFEIFVGGLDKDATEEDLREVFSKVGQVTEVRLMINPQTKKNKGFAFLRFATIEQSKRAVAELKNPVINGKKCGVTPSQDSDTLFLGNICKTWTKEALKEKLKHYGVDCVDEITLVEDSNNAGLNRGFAFLEFQSRSDAMDAFKRLQKRDVLFGVDRPAKVSFADSFIDPGDEIMSQVKTVFIDGLAPSWDESYLKELLKKYGEIEKIELASNMPSAKRKDFGFVTFDTHHAAVTCAKSINNTELGEKEHKAKVRARLSRPLQRSKGRNVGRTDYHHARDVERAVRNSWDRPSSRGFASRSVRGSAARFAPASVRRPVRPRDRRPIVSVPARGRPLPPPSRSYDRRPPVPSYPRSSLKREYSRREDLPPPRSRPVVHYDPRIVSERRPSYRDEYSSRESDYPDLPRVASHSAPRRAYIDDGYGQRYERSAGYRELRSRDYDSVSGSKRPYSEMDDVPPPRYTDPGVRHSRSRLDYELGGSTSHYGDAYGDRFERSSLGYGSSRTSASSQDSHGLYGSRQGMGYEGGSYGGNDVGGMYSSYSDDYMSRGDVGGSYTPLYSGRGMGGSSYMGGGSGGGSGSYY